MTVYESLTVALTGTSVSALVWLAYTHPRSYGKVADVIYYVGMLAAVIWMGYVVGYGAGSRAAIKHATEGGDISSFNTSPHGVTVSLIICAGLIATSALRFIHRLKDK